jgi:hypothetical protein
LWIVPLLTTGNAGFCVTDLGKGKTSCRLGTPLFHASSNLRRSASSRLRVIRSKLLPSVLEQVEIDRLDRQDLSQFGDLMLFLTQHPSKLRPDCA